eukprot:TRINITY_DN3508_c0_g1_i11.p1 TRINITY_DN3508_c0_g1~~TRINITY_DN3508_c0_g1_i11.p1  ORF type:complete len:118 (-),score=15.40 TRINITY_DN3508_c0_g1_i11:211-564(-)
MEFDSLLGNSFCPSVEVPKSPVLRPLQDPDEDFSYLELSADASACSKSSTSNSDAESDYESDSEHGNTSNEAFAARAKLKSTSMLELRICPLSFPGLRIKRSQSCAIRSGSYMEACY